MSDIYLSLTETPTVVTLSQPVISGALSSTVTVANTVTVALDANSLSALENVTVTVGAAVSVSNFPSTQTIAGTVTVGNSVTIGSLPAISGTVTANLSKLASHASSITKADNQIQIIGGYSGGSPTNATAYPLGVESTGYINSNLRWGGTGVLVDTGASALPVQGTVTIGNSVTIGSLPAISGTVTAGMLLVENAANSFPNQNSPVQLKANSQNGSLRVRMDYSVGSDANSDSVIGSTGFTDPSTNAYVKAKVVAGTVTIGSLPAISGTVTIGAVGGSVTIPVRLFAEKYGGAPNENAVLQVDDDGFLLSSLQKIAAGTALPNAVHYDGSNSSVYVRPVPGSTVTARLQDASGNNLTSTSIGGVQRLNVSLASAATPGGSLPSFVNVYGGSDGSAVRTISVDSTGRQNTNVQLPRVTFIDGSGTVATANTAITVFASSSTRSYLLVQVTTGSAFVNVGATATTVNGINLTAGQGYAWETTIPQGIVSLISTTTSSRYVAKEA